MSHRTDAIVASGKPRVLAAALQGGTRLCAALCTCALLALASPQPGLAGESPRGTVNLNTATVEQLEQLPGIGEIRARAVVAARKRSGGFKRVEELLEVKGIGQAALEKLRPYLSLEGKTTFRRE